MRNWTVLEVGLDAHARYLDYEVHRGRTATTHRPEISRVTQWDLVMRWSYGLTLRQYRQDTAVSIHFQRQEGYSAVIVTPRSANGDNAEQIAQQYADGGCIRINLRSEP